MSDLDNRTDHELPTAAPRFIVDYDTEYQFEEHDGGPMPCSPEVYAEAPYMKDGNEVTYDDYLLYYGNPDRHVVVSVRRQDCCPCCGSWVESDALYGIDFMDDDKEARCIGTFRLEQLPGYLHDVAADLNPAPFV